MCRLKDRVWAIRNGDKNLIFSFIFTELLATQARAPGEGKEGKEIGKEILGKGKEAGKKKMNRGRRRWRGKGGGENRKVNV